MRIIKKLLKTILFLALFLVVTLGCVVYFLRGTTTLRTYTINLFDDGYHVDENELVNYRDGLNYQRLSDDEKYVYSYLYHNTLNNDFLYELGDDYDSEEIRAAIEAFLYDWPKYYYINDVTIQSWHNAFYKYTILNIDNQEEITETIKNIDDKTETILPEVITDDDYQTIRNIYEYVIDHVEYVEDAEYCQDIRSSLLNGETVCAGFSKMFQHLAKECGFECYYVSGIGDKESHAWNLIKLNDNWYWVDTTYGDKQSIDLYLLCDDDFFLINHTPDESYPACDDDSMMLKETNARRFASFDKNEIKEFIDEAVQYGDDYFLFLFTSEEDYQNAYDWLIEDRYYETIYRNYRSLRKTDGFLCSYLPEALYLYLFYNQ